ncbi:MAG: long-chain fatty acid--CoA ligase [Acidimicrobiales bacterium]
MGGINMAQNSTVAVTIYDVVEQNARLYPDEPAMLYSPGDTQLSWAEFALRVRQFAAGLAALSISRGDRVAILDTNSIDYVTLHYAVVGVGAIFVPINAWLREEEIATILRKSQPALLVIGPAFREIAGKAAAASGRDPTQIKLRPTSTPGLRDFEPAAHAPAGLPPLARVPGIKASDAHMILFTSGTTGEPKGAIISHRRTMVDAPGAIGALGVRPRERYVCFTPLFHTAAWDYMKLFVIVGGSVCILDGFDAPKVLDAIAEKRCNAFFAVPLMLMDLLSAPNFETTDCSSLTLIAYSVYDTGETILRAKAELTRRGAHALKMSHVYGLTEGGPFVSILRSEDFSSSPDAVGTPVPGVIVELLDDDLNVVPAGTPGEICVRSPALMEGYWEDPRASEKAFEGGVLHTGDLGVVGVDGLLRVVDRKKDMIRTAGENVYAKEVERVIAGHPSIEDCAVIGVKDDRYDERVVAVVVLKEGVVADPDEMTSYVRSRIAGFKTPREWIIVDALPKTAVGKTAKGELRQLYDSPSAR